MFRIRFHGRGGQGMKTASRILGSTFFHAGYQVQDAPRYGAERRGAPIFAFVRAALELINERGVISQPDLAIVADESLMAVGAAGVCQGLGRDSILLINSRESAATWAHRLNLDCTILCLPHADDADETAAHSYAGAACAGAAARMVGVIQKEYLELAVREELAGLSIAVINANLDVARKAFDMMAESQGTVREGMPVPAADYRVPQWIEMEHEPAAASAPTIHAPGTSIQVRTGLWRSHRPLIDLERCKRCWWVCSTFCPDSCIEVSQDGVPGIDYDHCKGCLVCVERCPPHAIAALPESRFVSHAEEEAAA